MGHAKTGTGRANAKARSDKPKAPAGKHPAKHEPAARPGAEAEAPLKLPTTATLPTQASRTLAETLSMLSHDLRNPLTAMVWNVPSLRRSLPPEHPGRRPLEVVARSTDEIARMLDEMSDAARVLLHELGAKLRREPCAVASLVEEVTTGVRPTAEARQIALSVRCAPALAEIVCDRERVARVLSRLLAAAVRVTPKGTAVAMRAEPHADGARPAVRFTIEDAGPGVPEADRTRIFQLPMAPPPGEERRARTMGQGLSLFVARGIVEAHGGRIWVEGEPGASRFVLTLPSEEPPPDAAG